MECLVTVDLRRSCVSVNPGDFPLSESGSGPSFLRVIVRRIPQDVPMHLVGHHLLNSLTSGAISEQALRACPIIDYDLLPVS
jgi:hypothetical protein